MKLNCDCPTDWQCLHGDKACDSVKELLVCLIKPLFTKSIVSVATASLVLLLVVVGTLSTAHSHMVCGTSCSVRKTRHSYAAAASMPSCSERSTLRMADACFATTAAENGTRASSSLSAVADAGEAAAAPVAVAPALGLPGDSGIT